MALSDQATVLYLCSTPYAPAREHGVHPLDPAHRHRLARRTWRRSCRTKDAAAPALAEAQSAGLLPDYGDCLAYTAQLRHARLAGRW